MTSTNDDDNADAANEQRSRLFCIECRHTGKEKYFDRPSDLNKHELTHTRPCKCPFADCEFRDIGFPNSHDLKRHLGTHRNGQRLQPFICQEPGCGKGYTRKDNLWEHQAKHGHVSNSERRTVRRGRGRRATVSTPSTSRSTGARVQRQSSSGSSRKSARMGLPGRPKPSPHKANPSVLNPTVDPSILLLSNNTVTRRPPEFFGAASNEWQQQFYNAPTPSSYGAHSAPALSVLTHSYSDMANQLGRVQLSPVEGHATSYSAHVRGTPSVRSPTIPEYDEEDISSFGVDETPGPEESSFDETMETTFAQSASGQESQDLNLEVQDWTPHGFPHSHIGQLGAHFEDFDRSMADTSEYTNSTATAVPAATATGDCAASQAGGFAPSPTQSMPDMPQAPISSPGGAGQAVRGQQPLFVSSSMPNVYMPMPDPQTAAQVKEYFRQRMNVNGGDALLVLRELGIPSGTSPAATQSGSMSTRARAASMQNPRIVLTTSEGSSWTSF